MKRILITGCSGGGKSSLLTELAQRGHATVQEPGRLIVQQQDAAGGTALPWQDAKAFLDLVLAKAIADFEGASAPLTFFDRGIVDAVVGLTRMGHPCPEILDRYRYDSPVFMASPWQEIYETDAQRKHGFEEAKAEYTALAAALPDNGYDVIILPKISIETRADFVLERLT